MDEGASFEFVYTFKKQGWAEHLAGILLWIGIVLTISEMNCYSGTVKLVWDPLELLDHISITATNACLLDIIGVKIQHTWKKEIHKGITTMNVIFWSPQSIQTGGI